MKLTALSWALLGVLGSVAPAQAQRDADYGMPERTPENMASMALRRSSACALKKVPGAAGAVLATKIGSDDESKKTRKLWALARECYGDGWPDFGATAVRNTLAEVQYRLKYRTATPLQPSAVAAPESFAVVSSDTKGTPAQEATWYLAALAACTVFVSPDGARDLILGPINVPEEEKRFAKLDPAIGKCSHPGDANKLTPRLMRGFIANALYSRTIEADHG